MSRRPSMLPLLIPAVVLILSDASHSQEFGGVQCSVDAVRQRTPRGVTISAAVPIEASRKVPQHCRVDGSVATPGNAVNFRLGLPTNWNGKILFLGGGGFGGSIASLDSGLERGYASAATDTGHQGAAGDASWALNNPAKKVDYAYRGVHASAVAAKNVTRAYYRAAPRYSYFRGCSNGGREALTEAQRYPNDFDGIIAGDPSFGTLLNIWRAPLYQAMLSSPDRFLTPAKVDLISRAVLTSCDALDGLADGLITNPPACRFQPEALTCAGSDEPTCLTTGQIDTLKMITGELRIPTGDEVFPGFAPGHEDGATGWRLGITGADDPVRRANGSLEFGPRPPTGFGFMQGYLRYLVLEPTDPSFDWRTFTYDRHASRLGALADSISPIDADLSRFRARGGKLLLYHGWADPWLSPYSTLAYYDAVVHAAGGQQNGDEFIRLFMVPGMHHCEGGPGPNTFDMLTAIENWVERRIAPTRVIASHVTNGVVDRTRPLCPHPQVARYAGSGSIDAAENFRCEMPSSEPVPRQ